MKILVVDDEDLLVKGIRFNLQNEGYEVITGSNGLEALQLCQSASPDLIVLDVMMPEMDGMTACGKIREFSDVPIIMLTAKTDDMDKLMGFDHGADDYLTKPFNILELKARIRALLRRSGVVEKTPVNELTIGNITLDLNGCTISSAFKGAGCLYVGGRLVKFDEQGMITYLSPVLAHFTEYRPGQRLPQEEAKRIAMLEDDSEIQYTEVNATIQDMRCGVAHYGIKSPETVKEFYITYLTNNGETFEIMLDEESYLTVSVGDQIILYFNGDVFCGFTKQDD